MLTCDLFAIADLLVRISSVKVFLFFTIWGKKSLSVTVFLMLVTPKLSGEMQQCKVMAEC